MGKIQAFFTNLLHDDLLFTVVLILLVGIASFGLGRLSVITEEATPTAATVVKSRTISEETTRRSAEMATSTTASLPPTTGTYVASRNGTKYHLLTCPGAKQMSEQNKIYFNTKEEAASAGYQPAANCPGL